jgi:hypothetical protein
MLRRNYEVQVQACSGLREEIKCKEDTFREKIQVLETELKRFMHENSTRASEA